MGNDKDIVVESFDIEGNMKTVQEKWAEFTTALRYAPGPSNGPNVWLGWVRPETEGEAEQIFFEEITPEITRVNVAVVYDNDDLLEEGETFADVSRRVHQDMALFKDYVEGRLPKQWPGSAS